MSEEATLDEFADTSDTNESQERVTSRFWGEIPEGWRLVDGSEVYDVNPNPKSEEKSNTYIEMDALDTELPWPKYFGTRDASEYSGKTFTKGDTLFARITPCTENGKAALVPQMETEVGIGSTEFAVLSPKRDSINPWLLYYHGKSYPVHNYAVSRMRGSTGRQRVPFSVFRRELDIALPPFPEQRKIATVLRTVDRSIEKTEEIIKQSQRVREGVTQDIFTTGYYNHSEYSDVRLGPVKTSAPKDWGIKQIPDYFEIIDGDRGKHYPSGSDFSDQGYCLFLSATNVTEEGLKFDETEFITQEKDEELRKGKLKRGDIIMTTRGTVGNFGLYDESVDYDNIRINSGMVILRPKVDISSARYYYHLFRSGIFQRQINATSYGTAQPQTSVTDIKKMGVLDPSEDEKEKISKLIGDMVSEIQTQKEYRNQLQSLKRGLMQDLLSGKVRTTDTNIEVPEEVAQHG